VDRSIESWRVQYIRVERPRVAATRRNSRAAAPGAFTPKTAPMDWAEYSYRGGPTTPMTNTIIIL
jgi:hypothetical protein